MSSPPARWQTLREEADHTLAILDQTCLPQQVCWRRLDSLEQAIEAIVTLRVRGAPLIGATAAYAVALGLRAQADDAQLATVLARLAASRPTAVNLHWALARQRARLAGLAPAARAAAAWDEARAIAAQDVAANAAIAAHGLPLLQALAKPGQPLRVMTHCNAGWLATLAHGTALAPLYAAQRQGLALHVWVSETRPRQQGLLTAWELQQAGVPHSVIADNAAGHLMQRGAVDCLIVGADRIAANGDVANKIGTYLKALAAQAQRLPFFVAAPSSTFDPACPDGAHIPIEERAAAELGIPAALHCAAHNPAFDITPAALVQGVITERGVFAPQALAAALAQLAVGTPQHDTPSPREQRQG